MAFGEAEDMSVKTWIAFPELYRNGGCIDVGFVERNTLWEQCICPAVEASNPSALSNLPTTLKQIKTAGGGRLKTLQATQIELSQDQRQKFLLAFKEHTSNYEMFKS